MTQNTILVTGGAGYIGSHVCKGLFHAGFFPITYDNLSSGHPWAVQWGPLVVGDIHDRTALRSVFTQFRPCAVIHLAAFSNVRDSLTTPASYYRNNFLGTLSVLETMLEENVSYFVFSSTAAVYGRAQHIPIREEHSKQPLNPYGKSKWAVEQMLEDFRSAHGLKYAVLRYFNACGADKHGQIGEAHHPETHLIPHAMLVALEEHPYLEIYGRDHPTPDGTAIRDYVHVSDLAEAHICALLHLQNGIKSFAVNLGTGQGYSVQQIVHAIEKHTGKTLSICDQPRLEGDSPVLVADPTEAQRVLQWRAHRSDLGNIIASAWQWHLSQQPVAT